MLPFTFLLILFPVLLGGSAAVSADKPESAKPRTTVVHLLRPQDEARAPAHDEAYSHTEFDTYESDDDDYESGDYDLEYPRVAFSTKPKDSAAVPITETRRKDRKDRKGRKKGKDKKRDPCLRKYKDFCIHGVCQSLKELRRPSCVCKEGYSGERCHVFTLLVSREEPGYSQTASLAMVAVVLSLMCLTVIIILLALRYHRKGDYNVESEEKIKLEMTSVQ